MRRFFDRLVGLRDFKISGLISGHAGTQEG
jgi:hypothetical protein